MNTREFLLGIKPQVASVIVNGQPINVKEMTLLARAKYESELMNYQQGKVSTFDVRSNAILNCVVDENGDRVFQDSDLNAIKSLPSHVANDIFEKILKDFFLLVKGY